MNDPSELYKIGTVAKLTGIAVERLRAWERRYGLTPASREGKTRFFSGSQVERLTRIKRLIDQGHPVSTLINLDDTALNERLQQVSAEARASHSSGSVEGEQPQGSPRVGLIGTQLLMLEQTLAQPSRIDVVSRWVNLSVALPELRSADLPPEFAVVLLGSVTPDSLDELSDLPAKTKPLVVYHYATEEGLASADEREWVLLRWPATWAEIEQAAVRQAKSPLRAQKAVARRFSDEQLLNIASVGPGLGCACPADLVNLISALNAFSDHSAACSSHEVHREVHRGQEQSAGPAAPGRASSHPPHAHHNQISMSVSQARLELELVLEDWVMAEGLLPTPN